MAGKRTHQIVFSFPKYGKDKMLWRKGQFVRDDANRLKRAPRLCESTDAASIPEHNRLPDGAMEEIKAHMLDWKKHRANSFGGATTRCWSRWRSGSSMSMPA